MNNLNSVKFIFPSFSENEALARNLVSCFLLPLNPSVSELSEIKTAVSEAVTNAIVHGYSKKKGNVTVTVKRRGEKVKIRVEDKGVGIENVEKALEPFYTTSPESERSGMGFTIIQSFMDGFTLRSVLGKGTVVEMWKVIGKNGDANG